MQLTDLLQAGKHASMTSFFSLAYLGIFLPASILGYSIVPKKLKKYFLLLASFGFFWLISGELIIYLLLTILSVHYFGIWLDRIQQQQKEQLKLVERSEKKAIKKHFLTRQRLVVLLAVALQVGVILVLKYSEFFTDNVNSLLTHLHMSLQLKIPEYLVPIGISFFTMQALSYILDVYHGVVKADENIGRLALFISFFPQIIEGPICRYSQTADRLWKVEQISFHNLTFGLQRILFGAMKKIVVADRLNPIITEVFTNYKNYDGGVIALAAVCYTVQLYMDFSGAMDAVLGTAQIFGVSLPENFERPFFSKTISEFWKRWHITLGTWFKDYIFYPVVAAKSMKSLTSSARKKIGNHFGPLLAGSIAMFCVWSCNGLWHGAGWHYIFFGMYHFALILSGNIVSPLIINVNKKLHIKPDWFVYRLLQMLRTAVLVVIGELFFRAHGLRAGLVMFKKLVTDFTFKAFNGELLTKLGVDVYDLIVVCIVLLIVLIISILNEKGVCVRESLSKKNIVFRWIILLSLILIIIVFGAYGRGYIPVDPIYANF